jgi:hypothetical protein
LTARTAAPKVFGMEFYWTELRQKRGRQVE